MTKNDVELCVADLNSKRSEGFDQIPGCALLDSRDSLLNPMDDLFKKIYTTGSIPEQLKALKICHFSPLKAIILHNSEHTST